jgi:membrane-associated phospholipid phosphatase
VTRRGFTATDRLVVGYVAINSVILVSRAGQLAAWPWLLFVNGLVLVLVALLARAPDSVVVAFLGGGYAPLLTGALYTQLGLLGIAGGHFHDPLVQRWEAAVFGSQVSVTWHQAMPSVALSWLMHGAYWAYFAMIPTAMLALWLRAGRDAYARAGFIIALGFYACYVIEALFPVMGPRHFFGDATGPIADILPARLMKGTQHAFTAMGTAFPSSHVAAAWCAVYALWRDLRRLALWLAPIAVVLAFATVYGQFHYGVDALAGAALALVLCALADPLRSALGREGFRSSSG